MDQTATITNTSKWDGGKSPYNLSYGKIMMWFFLFTDALTFGALLISNGAKRFFSEVWPNANYVFKSYPFADHSTNAPLVFVSIMTFILIISSVTMVLAVHSGHYMDKKGVAKWLVLTIIGGLVFLACQCWEWVHLHHEGAWWGSFLNPETTSVDQMKQFYKPDDWDRLTLENAMSATTNFFNFFFTITGFHGVHVLSGVIFNLMILINTVNGVYERRGHYEMVEKIGLYWHFVDLVWVFVFTVFYLV